jgi:tetratricopeptide (TPR) repeat protein
MNAHECYNFLKRLNTDSLSGASREYLDRSCHACKANDEQSMLELARSCLSITLECKDQAGQAAALIHLGMAHARQEQFDEAIQNCLEAKRIYHRSPDQRYNESTVAYGLGLIYQQCGPLSKAISYYEEAIRLLRQVRNDHAATGNKEQFTFIQVMSDRIEQHIASLLDA